MNVRKPFLEEISKPIDQIDIETCALLFAAEIQPDLNVLDAVLSLDAQVNKLSSNHWRSTGQRNRMHVS